MALAQTIVAILFTTLLITLDCQQSQPRKSIFPHKIWVFWHSDFDKAPMFTQLCVNSMRTTAQKNDWQFVLLNSESIYDYLSEKAKSQLQFVKSKASLTQASLSDFYRLLVLYDHGGVWMDANSFFVRDLSWIEQIGQQKGVYNKLTKEPEMIMFTYNQVYGGNKTIVYDQERKTNVMLFPGLEFWTFVAKPKAKFLGDILERNVGIFNRKSKEDYMEENRKLGYQYGSEGIPYFLYANYALQSTLQHRQRDIQANPAAYTVKYAVQYYNIWCLDAIEGPFQIFDQHQWLITVSVKHLFYSTIEEAIQSKDSLYFFKFTRLFYEPSDALLQMYVPLYCLDAATPIPENSIFNQFLLKPNEQMDFVKKLRQMERNKREGILTSCEIVERSKEGLSFFVKVVALAFLLLNAAVFWAVKYCCLESDKPKDYEKINPS